MQCGESENYGRINVTPGLRLLRTGENMTHHLLKLVKKEAR